MARPKRAKLPRGSGSITVWLPPALERDIRKLAKREIRSVSAIGAGLIRLGLGRYYELADARLAKPLAEAMADLFDEDDPFPQAVREKKPPSAIHLKIKAMVARGREFDAAIEEGLQRFNEAVSR